MNKYLFTSESVSEGHPDKLCDRISDAILDAYLTQDPYARVAVETLATTNHVVLAGEVNSKSRLTFHHLEDIVRHVIREIGYEQENFHWKTVKIEILIHQQSEDIARGVDSGEKKEEGAGDQGLMFGYACRETPVFMPAPLYYAHNMLKSLSEARHSGALPELGPDSKSQVTLVYEEGIPIGLHSVVVSTQHTPDVTQETIREIVRPHVFNTIPQGWTCPEERFFVNPTGRFVIGGPDGDTGLTGRKIIVDTYGGVAPHGGGAFSGKDPTKVDRSAAYAARYLAKNIVAAGLSDKCLVQLAYVIGVSYPISIYLNTFGTGHVDEQRLTKFIPQLFSLSPRGIREHLGLNRPIYARTAAYGHFGREPEADGGFSWEKLTLVEELKRNFS